MHEHSPESGSGTQILHYSMIATCVGGGYECVIIMRVISRVIFHSLYSGTNYWMKATCVGGGYECVIMSAGN